MRVLSFSQNHYLSQLEIEAFFVFEHLFFEILSQNHLKRLNFVHFKPILAYFLVRQTTLSTCPVLGNISTGSTPPMVYPRSANILQSLARVSGSQET